MAEKKRRTRDDDLLLRECSVLNDGDNKFFKQGLSFFDKVHEISPQNYMPFLNFFWNYGSGLIDKMEFQKSIISLIGENPPLVSDFSDFMRNSDEIIGGSSVDKKQKIEIEKSVEKKCTGRRSPRGGRKPKPEEGLKKEAVKETVADERKKKERRVKETKMEDAMYEADMCISWCESAISFAERVSNGTLVMAIEGMFRNNFFRCVQQLYGDDTDVVLGMFKKDPVSTSTTVLVPLRRRLLDLKYFRIDLGESWRKMY